MSKWEEKMLRDLCSDISYGYTESATYTEVGPKFLRITDITSDYINWETVPFCKISEQDFEKYKLQYNDIVIARTGATSGYNQQFRENIDAVYASYLIRFRIDESKANPRFVYYYLQSSAYKGFINNYISGAAQPGINATVLSKLKIPLPDEKTQKHIAIVLSVYDDLIEANNRRIELLEQAAQDLYKEWFVRFRFPGYENTKFESGLPEGWDFCRLGKIMSFGAGKTRPESGETYPVYGGNGILDYCNYYNNENAIIIGRVGAYCGTVYYEPDKCWISDNALFAESKNDASFYNYYLLKNMNLNARQVGTGQPLITQGLLNKIKILLPPEPVVKKFNEISSELLKQQHALRKQNTNLATQRDMLLPRLMSGKLEVN
ncbi:MAG: restriction endonuclease subunit S [Firmicutes bacterium]|nr:restriction endonuclease subunit S [Bacillota bacterium]